MIRVYSNQELTHGNEVSLDGTASHHLANVVRARVGDSVIIFNGDGYDYHATLTRVGKKSALSIESSQLNSSESNLQIHLLQGVSRGDRMDYCIQKAVELGVSSIRVVFSEKSQVKLQRDRIDKRLRHWQAIIVSACEQCGRSVLPALGYSASLEDAIASCNQTTFELPVSVKLLLQPEAKCTLATVSAGSGSCLLIVGPESGLSAPEVEFAISSGYTPIAIGPRVLRTETAAPAAISILQAIHGDMG